MIDFLRANPWCSREEYTWHMTIPQIRLASFDFSHVEYLDKENGGEDGNTVVIGPDEALTNLTDLGVPIL